jgi:transcriptional regulator GlxA family with amidase domain
MKTIGILALDGVIAFDLTTPIEVFGRTRLPDGEPAYAIGVCGPVRTINTGAFDMHVPHRLDWLKRADTIIVPGLNTLDMPIPGEALAALRAAAKRGTHIASICVGAFVLAASGLLDGLRATTHWAAARELARRYPNVTVDPNLLYVDNGQILTSAGAAAGIDMCLNLVRCDYGARVAAASARAAVMPLERAGGQAQFIDYPDAEHTKSSFAGLLEWINANMARTLSISDLAQQVTMSVRHFSRRFQQQVGMTPLQWLHHVRIRRAQLLLETTDLPIEQIATQTGFGSLTTLRDRFKLHAGVSPNAYRRTFRRLAHLQVRN